MAPTILWPFLQRTLAEDQVKDGKSARKTKRKRQSSGVPHRDHKSNGGQTAVADRQTNGSQGEGGVTTPVGTMAGGGTTLGTITEVLLKGIKKAGTTLNGRTITHGQA